MQAVSIGKKETELSFKSKNSYASTFGGIATIISVIIILLYAGSVFYHIILRSSYNLKQSTTSITALNYQTIPVNQILNSFNIIVHVKNIYVD